MKLGVISPNLMGVGFEEGLQYAQNLGLQAIEVAACGPAASDIYCDRERLVADKGEVRRWLEAFERRGLEISALLAHGAPLSPNKRVADEYTRQFCQACDLMGMAGLTRMTILAGLPEGAEGDTAPNWVAFAEWADLRDIVKWQWEKRVLPYWREQSKVAADNGVTLCFEMHGGDMVHNPITAKRLHDELGDVAACNLDTSHMWYQGIDPIEAIRFLGPLVRHVHAKDTFIHDHHARVRGLFDTASTEEPANRSWTYAPPGWGHDSLFWREFVATLRLVGYDDVLSIESESEYFDVREGVEKAVGFLKPIILERAVGPRWWEEAGIKRAGELSMGDEES